MTRTMNKLGRGIEETGLKGNEGSNETATEEKPVKNKGKLIMDATVADQMTAYPTDLGLLARSREESERLIDMLCKKLDIKDKPRTYRRLARKIYLNVAKKKNKSKKEIRKGIGQQLRYLNRNLKNIDKLSDTTEGMSFPLEHRDQRIYRVIQHIYEQQYQMYKEHTHSVDSRIVNIYQPYVRPFVRGKDKAQVEFGAKPGVSIQNGYARINTLSWEAYNEVTDLKKQVEGKFGQGKNGYNLDKIRARSSKTSESWIAAIFFVMNLIKFSKEFLFSFLKEVLLSLFLVQDIFIWHRNRFMLAKTK
ncbi:MAG: hypothetical protein DDT42_01636 [candidate division WS2 bacterium]|uniref:Transposase DDE domain-containing protein n=1 Tax=Psychracetigena formicireducens TaxID=2986056 RepID=A0A9E2BIK1_PSYF1|nr:hypothetical protein [Candidatus Psychracetigena formicireducens]